MTPYLQQSGSLHSPPTPPPPGCIATANVLLPRRSNKQPRLPFAAVQAQTAVTMVVAEQGKKIVLLDNDVRRDVIQRRNLIVPVALGDALP
jgi:hypothetical protein